MKNLSYKNTFKKNWEQNRLSFPETHPVFYIIKKITNKID